MQFNLRSLDIYRKVPKDLTQPTTTGAIISVCSILFITFLVISEFLLFMNTEFASQMYVSDPTAGDERILVRISIIIPKMNCKYLGIDIQDDMGRHEVGHVEDVIKTPIPETDGCKFVAAFRINKVPGNFHLATHSSKEIPPNPNMQHQIEYVAFGDDMPLRLAEQIPGSFNPLRNVSKLTSEPTTTHDYFIKVVPSSVTTLSGRTMRPYQYTYAYRSYMNYGHGNVVPALWFRYDLTPITVSYTERRQPFYHFLTMCPCLVNLLRAQKIAFLLLVLLIAVVRLVLIASHSQKFCAIIGGTFTVASIIDSLIFTTHNWVKKAEIGKLG